MKDGRRNMENGYQAEDYSPMPKGVKPPKRGSGVPNKSSEKRKNLYARVKLIEALSGTLSRNIKPGHSLIDLDIDRIARNKLVDVLKSLEVT